jgi:hypothetical protein
MPVFPCHGKVPLISKADGGHGFYDATVDLQQITTWWQQYPKANIGYRTSATAPVLDVDPQHGGDDTLFALEQTHGALPETRRVVTGGPSKSTHYYFTSPEAIPNKSFLGVGIDVQGEGSYVIVPPSLHPATGQPYLWDIGPDERAPHPLPDWLLQLLLAGDVSATSASQVLDPTAPIPDGTRTRVLGKLAIRLRRVAGLSEGEMLAALQKRNERCVPPKSQDFLVKIANYVCGKYQPDPVMHVGSVPFFGSPGSSNGTTAPADPQWGTPRPKAIFTDVADMIGKDYPVPVWLIKGLIMEGFTILAGSPKSSKTYLAHSLALTLALESAQGGLWLDHYPLKNHGPVVYVSLEDDEGDSYWRVCELVPGITQVDRNRLIFCNDFENIPSLNDGLIEFIDAQILQVYHPVLLVLDPLSYLYPPARHGGDQFDTLRQWLLPLRYLGKRTHTAIVGVEHRRKQSKDDISIVETIRGSNAKVAVADSLIVIVRDLDDVTMHATVRKGSDQTISLGFSFDKDGAAHWTWKGSTEGLLQTGTHSDMRIRVSQLLGGNPQSAYTIPDILSQLKEDVNPAMHNLMRQLLHRMEKAGEVTKQGRGAYVWATGTP